MDMYKIAVIVDKCAIIYSMKPLPDFGEVLAARIEETRPAPLPPPTVSAARQAELTGARPLEDARAREKRQAEAVFGGHVLDAVATAVNTFREHGVGPVYRLNPGSHTSYHYRFMQRPNAWVFRATSEELTSMNHQPSYGHPPVSSVTKASGLAFNTHGRLLVYEGSLSLLSQPVLRPEQKQHYFNHGLLDKLMPTQSSGARKLKVRALSDKAEIAREAQATDEAGLGVFYTQLASYVARGVHGVKKRRRSR